jgi:hypothetical protein
MLTAGLGAAADLPARAPYTKAPVAIGYDGTGFYLGGYWGTSIVSIQHEHAGELYRFGRHLEGKLDRRRHGGRQLAGQPELADRRRG